MPWLRPAPCLPNVALPALLYAARRFGNPLTGRPGRKPQQRQIGFGAAPTSGSGFAKTPISKGLALTNNEDAVAGCNGTLVFARPAAYVNQPIVGSVGIR